MYFRILHSFPFALSSWIDTELIIEFGALVGLIAFRLKKSPVRSLIDFQLFLRFGAGRRGEIDGMSIRWTSKAGEGGDSLIPDSYKLLGFHHPLSFFGRPISI